MQVIIFNGRMNMKQIFKFIAISFAAVMAFSACQERYVTYEGDEYVMFADTLAVYPVMEGAEEFSIPVVSTVVRDYDRTFGVEVIDRLSNAIERKHYSLESNTITIKAGETRADVKVRGHYENIGEADSLGFALQLVMKDELVMPLYGKQTKAVIMKTGKFDRSKFTGYCVLSSMFLQNYSQNGGYNRLVYTEPHPTLNNTIICRNWLKDGYDVELTFNDEDPLMPVVTMARTVAGDQGSFFGTSYGQWGDKLYVRSSNLAQSIFYPLGGYLYIWTEFSVDEYGIVGDFYNVMQWVTDEEAERIMREGF
jgi:hypothetical protein